MGLNEYAGNISPFRDMNVMSRLRKLLWLLILVSGCFAVSMRADAQGLGLTSSVSSSLVLGTNTFSYSIVLTNHSGIVRTNVAVTNTFSADVSLLGTTNTQGTNYIVGSSVVFFLGTLSNNTSATMSLTNRAVATGFLTNTIISAATGVTNLTNIIVIQIASSLSDLAVSIIPPVQAVITNDLTAYNVIVTNRGPGSAPGVLLTNTFPPGVVLINAGQSYTQDGTNLIFSLGTLATGGSANIRFDIKPTNVASLFLTASIGAPALADPNLTNNTAGTNLDVIAYLDATLVVVTNSGQIINFQNGLIEQTVWLSNTGTNDIPAARLVVTGLTNQLFNAVGTNGSSPFVYLSANLAAGSGVGLTLQYNPRKSFPFTNGQLHAFAVPRPKWPPARAVATSTNVNISRIVRLGNGQMVIEFPSTLGQAYTVVYSDEATFSNAMIAPPTIIAPANRVQWIDYGPPTTESAPTNSTARFYRVYQNP